MAKGIRFYKQICAVATAFVMVAGMPMCVHATDNLTADSEYSVDISSSDDQDDDSSDDSSNSSSDADNNTNIVDDNVGNPALTDDNISDVSEDVDSSLDADTDADEEDLNGQIIMIDPDPDEDASFENSAEGIGSIKITTIRRPENVVSMVVPILDRINYDFVLDPEGLLSNNPDNMIIGGESSVYFRSDEDNTFCAISDVATAVNRSTVPVSFEVELEVRGCSENGIAVTDFNGVYAADVPSLCFAILPTEIGTVTDGEDVPDLNVLKSGMVTTGFDGRAYKEIILPGSVDNFDIETYETDEPDVFIQEYLPKDDAQWSAAGFALYGVCTRDADWSDVAEKLQEGGNLSFVVTYSLTPIFGDGEDE